MKCCENCSEEGNCTEEEKLHCTAWLTEENDNFDIWLRKYYENIDKNNE